MTHNEEVEDGLVPLCHLIDHDAYAREKYPAASLCGSRTFMSDRERRGQPWEKKDRQICRVCNDLYEEKRKGSSVVWWPEID